MKLSIPFRIPGQGPFCDGSNCVVVFQFLSGFQISVLEDHYVVDILDFQFLSGFQMFYVMSC